MTWKRFGPFPSANTGGGHARHVHRITCSKCSNTHEVSIGKSGGTMALDHLVKIFHRHGWDVGRNASHDVCPECSSARRKAKRSAGLPTDLPTEFQPLPTDQPRTAKIIEMATGKEATPPIVSAAEPPAEMSRDDRRVIFAKLQDAYVDEKTGYAAPWTDKLVARDLGVPIAWVAKVRDEMFGPAKDNDDIRALLADARAAKEDAEAIFAETKAALGRIEAEGASLKQRLRDAERKLADLDRHVGKLVALVA